MLSFFVQYDFRIFSAASVFAYQEKLGVCGEAVASVAVRKLYLVSKIDVIVFEKLYGLSVWQAVFQVYVKSVEQVEIVYLEVFDFEGV